MSDPLSEGYGSPLGVLVKRISRQARGYGAAEILPLVASFLLLPVFTRYLGPREFGVYALLQVVSAIFAVVVSLGITAMTPFYFTEEHDPERRRRKLGNLLVSCTGINLAFLGLFLSAGRPLIGFLVPSLPFYPLVPLTLGQGFLTPYIDLAIVTYKMREQAARVAWMRAIQLAISSVLQIHFVVFRGTGLSGLVGGSFLGSAIAAAIFLLMIRKDVALWFSWRELKNALRLGLPALPTSLFTNAYRLGDRIILERLVAHERIGLYYLAVKFGDVLKTSIEVVGQSWLPVFYKEARDRSKIESLIQAVVLMVVLFGFGGVVLTLAAEAYVRFAMEEPFHEVIPLLPFVMTAQLLKGNNIFPHLSIWLSKRSYYFPLITILPMTANIGLNLWLVPTYGVYGAAGVMVLCFLVHVLLTYALGQRAFRLPYDRRRMIGATASGTAIIFLASTLASEAGIGVRAVLAVGGYLIVALLIVVPMISGLSVPRDGAKA